MLPPHNAARLCAGHHSFWRLAMAGAAPAVGDCGTLPMSLLDRLDRPPGTTAYLHARKHAAPGHPASRGLRCAAQRLPVLTKQTAHSGGVTC